MRKLIFISLLLFVTLNSFGQSYFKITQIMSDQYSWRAASGHFILDEDIVKIKTPQANFTVIIDRKTYKKNTNSNGVDMVTWEAEIFNEESGAECMFSMVLYDNSDVSILIYFNDDDYIAFYGKKL